MWGGYGTWRWGTHLAGWVRAASGLYVGKLNKYEGFNFEGS